MQRLDLEKIMRDHNQEKKIAKRQDVLLVAQGTSFVVLDSVVQKMLKAMFCLAFTF